ncbi:MAG: hypothetical protein FWD61_06430, partial [Phycisphaerales bacterium]|nr:hypothetical protein [Phycisphaerales bacterium]
ESSQEGQTWAGRIVNGMLEEHFEDWWQLVVDERARVRSPGSPSFPLASSLSSRVSIASETALSV